MAQITIEWMSEEGLNVDMFNSLFNGNEGVFCGIFNVKCLTCA